MNCVMLSYIYDVMNMITNAIVSLLTSDDNSRCEAVANNIWKDYSFLNLMYEAISALACTVRKLKHRVRGLT